jgi:tetratricopeptide (TPR) repeat protein
MPTPGTSHLPQPKDWNDFEDICADLFGLEWDDRNAFRYGRQGQRQDGIDIYGSPANRGTAGVQCKGRRHWPPHPLTTGDIDAAVAEAKKFKHPITEFVIATTANDDAKLQDHALAITRDNRGVGLFSVHVFGWDELSRRLTSHDELLKKHYSFVTLQSVHKDIDEIPQRTADIVVERLRETGVPFSAAPERSTTVSTGLNSFQEGITQALERDLSLRYCATIQRSLFPEANRANSFKLLAREVLEGPFTAISAGLRRQVFLRAARSTALRGELDEAQRFLRAALALPGNDTDVPAKARLAEASGDVDGAIQILRDQKDADSRSTLFHILVSHRGEAAGLAFLTDHNLSVADLTVNGIHTLCILHLKQGNIETTKQVLSNVSEEQFYEGPYLLFLRGAVRIAALVSQPDQGMVLRGPPLDVRFARAVASRTIVSAELDAAIADLNRIISISQELGLWDARRIAEAYITWSEFLHPDRRDAALGKLRNDMADPKTALARLPFAFAYDPDFDPSPLEKYLEKREQLGGLDDEELKAALILGLHGDNPRVLADLIAKNRERFEAAFGKPGILSIEIQALAMAGDVTSARLLFEPNRGLFDGGLTALLEAEIAKAEGSDPVAENKRVYEATKSVESLRALISQLVKRKDHRALAHYAEILYQQTNDPVDAVLAGNAFANAGDDENFLRVLKANPFVEERDPVLARHHAWKLFHHGQLHDAKRIARELRKSAKLRDLELEIAIAIESGDWEALATPLSAYLENASSYSGPALIRAARLSQASGQGSIKGLMDVAVENAGNDPGVLVGAYTIVLEEGLEDKKPEASVWFRRALDVSGDDGPIKRFELKDLLAHQLEWNEYTRKINDAVNKGDLPMTFAASGLRTTVVNVVLGNLLRNSTLNDPRKRIAMPLFSGRRVPSPFGEASRIALDASALMVAGWLGLLPKIMNTYTKIVISAGALQELFEGRSRIREFQKSRIERARQIKEAVAGGRLKVVPPTAALRDPLINEVGAELAALLRAANIIKGVVIRPAPVKRVGVEEDREADLSAYAENLTDMHTVLTSLIENGAVDQAAENVARGYFGVQDKGWPSPALPGKKSAIFIDGLALIYLQTVNLLDTLLDTFPDVYVDSSTKEEAEALIDYESHTKAILETIDDIRSAVHNAYESGRLLFGPQRKYSSEEDEAGPPSSTLNLLSDLMEADVAVIDDRAINKDPFVVDSKGHRAPLANSLDLIEDLAGRGVLSEIERRMLRHRLRVAGAVLVPIQADEVVAAALRSKESESAEFRAIRESIGLARIAEVPRFPAEIRWFASVSMAIQHALIQLWNREPDHERAALIADSILDLRPEPEDWIARWEGHPPPGWSEAVSRMMAASLTLPIELNSQEATRAYNDWLEARVLAPLRNISPERYQAVVQQVRGFILDFPEDTSEE